MSSENMKEQSGLLPESPIEDNRMGEQALQRVADLSITARQPEVVVVTGASAGLGADLASAFGTTLSLVFRAWYWAQSL